MDILGTKQKFSDEKSSNELIQLIDLFTSTARSLNVDCQEVYGDLMIKYQVNGIDAEISNFSDHILASYPYHYDAPPYKGTENNIPIFLSMLIMICLQFHACALNKGMLMRGAITEGNLLHVGNKVTGEALNDAVWLEEKIAIYPRVIIPNQLATFMGKVGISLQNNCIKRDFDGVYLIDYLQSNFLEKSWGYQIEANKYREILPLFIYVNIRI